MVGSRAAGTVNGGRVFYSCAPRVAPVAAYSTPWCSLVLPDEETHAAWVLYGEREREPPSTVGPPLHYRRFYPGRGAGHWRRRGMGRKYVVCVCERIV
jgi:hypothetical protein